MPNLDLPILVVDDAKFSGMVVGRTLRKAGYRDVRIANNATAALDFIEQRPDGINHKALKTTAGYISVEAGMVLCRADGQDPTPSVKQMERAAVQGLIDAYDTRRFTAVKPEIGEKA